jgi:hypothetical protein
VASTSGPVPPPTSVIVHPLVLLSATDHYMRVAKDTSKRVVGVLLGAKEIVGDRDTLRTATHEGQVADRPFMSHPADALDVKCEIAEALVICLSSREATPAISKIPGGGSRSGSRCGRPRIQSDRGPVILSFTQVA